MVRPRTFLDFASNNESDTNPLGRVIFELFNDTAPKTCENFRALCTGEKGLSASSSIPLYYKNSTIHRSIKDFMIQGGDFTKFDGKGGESIYGSTFADEDLTRPLDSEALLCMANKGLDTNGSQFFVTLTECPHLNGKHVVFGRVIRGFDVIQKIASLPVDSKHRPLTPIVVSNCGELELRQPAATSVTLRETSEPLESSRRRRSRRSRSRSESPSRSRSPAREKDRERRHKKKKTKRRKTSEDPNGAEEKTGSKPTSGTHQETEEEYDARLEREEKERLEAARKRELEKFKERYQEPVGQDGVRYKGRGRMKFLDPESNRDRRY